MGRLERVTCPGLSSPAFGVIELSSHPAEQVYFTLLLLHAPPSIVVSFFVPRRNPYLLVLHRKKIGAEVQRYARDKWHGQQCVRLKGMEGTWERDSLFNLSIDQRLINALSKHDRLINGLGIHAPLRVCPPDFVSPQSEPKYKWLPIPKYNSFTECRFVILSSMERVGNWSWSS